MFTIQLSGHTINPVSDFINTAVIPWKTKNLKYTGLTLGITAGLFLADENITEYMRKHQSSSFSEFIKYPKLWGDGHYIIAGGSVLLLSGLIIKEPKITSLGIYIYEGFLYSGLYVTFVKFIFGRARPYTEEGSLSFHPFSTETANTSFYSGHTTEAFTLSSIIANYFKNTYISILAYTVSALTGIERVYNNKHWTSDVFLGAVTGIIIGKSIIDNNTDIHYDWKNSSIRISIYSRGL